MITHESWQRIKEIFQSAQEFTGPDRSKFLDKACGDDASIRGEVEALLTADAGNQDFLSAPAYEFAASMLATQGSEFAAGQKIGRYTILYQLGSGGMGQIYLAQDAQLGRKIALKLISPEFAEDPRRVHRFEQEARASSALNHPNICVIHEIGQTDAGRHFIAMEYIQGMTVRDRLSRKDFTVLEALNISLQVAAALSSAHATGIVHRDIKPENIMLRPDGYVKVLDFGLAKLVELLPEQQGRNRASTVRTEAGTLMGTVKYMSPEQLREADVDERADIWSLGVVLYEMLTGSTPFEGRTSHETVALILSAQAAPLNFPDSVPKKLQGIVKRALEKDRDDRYQTITKLAFDLQRLQRELRRAAENESEVFHTPSLVLERRTRQMPVGSALFTRLKSQALHTADLLISEIRTHKAAAIFGMTGVLALLILLPNLGGSDEHVAYTPKALTRSGTTIVAAVSSTGQLLAHAEEQDGKQRLMLTSLNNFGSSMVVEPASVRYLGISFSRDNNYVYFTRREEGPGVLYRLPVHGIAPVRVKDNVDSPIAFSPDGNHFAFVRLNPATSEYSLVISNTDGSNERTLATRKNGETLSVYGATWSPDGRVVVCPVGFWREGFHTRLMGFNVEDGREQPIGEQTWFSILQVAWRADMSGLVMSAREHATSPHQLWRISYPGAVTQRITHDLTEYQSVSLSGENIVTVQTTQSWQMLVAGVESTAAPTPIGSGASFSYGVTWTPKGKIVFSSMAQDRLDLIHVNPDGSGRVQLTFNAGDNYNPAASPDGRFIVFASNRNGSFNIWRINSDDGSQPKQLTFTDGNFYPAVSADNQWVAYDQQTALKLSIWKVPLEGGQSTKLIDGYRMPAFSPDSQFIAGRYDHESGTRDVIIFPADGGVVSKTLTEIPILEWQRLQWINSHALSYVAKLNGYSNIWSYDIHTGEAKQLTNFTSQYVYAYAWSPDFKQVACQCGNQISDVTMLTPDPQR